MHRPVALIAAGLFSIGALSARPACAAVRPLPADATAVKTYAGVLHAINPNLQSWQSHMLAKHVLQYAARWRVDANLLVAIVTVESRWHTDARSRVGAIGLGQLMPETAELLRVNPHNPIANLFGCARYLSGLIVRFRDEPNHYQRALAAYNAGPMAVERFGGIPPYAETEQYVVRVMRQWHHLVATVRIKRHTASARDVYWNSGVSAWSAVDFATAQDSIDGSAQP
ncbi:MAG: lytic transglycosylase domain-containing protein [Candidatus Eremiobacteraeota bacterium]|nr:lytic transglycosylase domain-containing protein [Candidatus Eremiobacteraeota bacterium]